MKEMDLLPKLTQFADNFMEKGFGIFKVIEEFKVERVYQMIDLDRFTEQDLEAFRALSEDEQRLFLSDKFELDLEEDEESIDDILKQFNAGETEIEYYVDQITSFPKLIVRDSERVLFPTYMEDICQSERVTDEFFLTERQLIERGINGAYDLAKIKRNFKEAKSDKTSDSLVDAQKNTNEGITDYTETELYKLREAYSWRPTGPKGRYERWVITFMCDAGQAVEAAIGVRRYLDDEWPFEMHKNEIKDSRPYSSRGIPEQIRALQQMMEKAINNMLTRDEINNNTIFTKLSKSKVQASQNQMINGQVLTVGAHDEIQQLTGNTSKVDLSSNLIVDKLKAFAEEYLGSTDQLFRNATNEGGGKTLGEIERGLQLSAQLQSLDLMLFNNTMKRVYKKIWKILRTGLIKPFYVDGVRVTQAIFDFDPEITPTGSIDSLNTNTVVQRALARVNLIIQQVQLGLIANAEDLYNAMEDLLIKDGVKDVEKFITRPEQIQQERQQAAQQQQAILQQAENELAQRQQQAEARVPREVVNE